MCLYNWQCVRQFFHGHPQDDILQGKENWSTVSSHELINGVCYVRKSCLWLHRLYESWSPKSSIYRWIMMDFQCNEPSIQLLGIPIDGNPETSIWCVLVVTNWDVEVHISLMPQGVRTLWLDAIQGFTLVTLANESVLERNHTWQWAHTYVYIYIHMSHTYK